MGKERSIDTVVIGAGHAGLAMSWYLSQAGRDHVVLDGRETLGGGWQDRWDSFCLVTPNRFVSFPGRPYAGADPDGFMARDEIKRLVAEYASAIRAPVELGTRVRRVARAGDGFLVETTAGDLRSDRVVAAVGGYHQPRIPEVATALPTHLTQVHTHAYRNAAALPAGAVLVVGSGQSGVQIAEELHDAGRRVYLSVGTAGRLPRRYRGRDIFAWLGMLATVGSQHGVGLPTIDQLPDPRLRFAGNPHLSGHGGGHDTNLRQMALDGITLVGRIRGVDGERVAFADDLSANLARADGFFDQRIRQSVDTLIERLGIDAPPDDRKVVEHEPASIGELDLAEAGISTVVWASGYRADFSWLDMPVLDEFGMPRQRRGVADVPGLFFLGLPWQHTMASATLGGPAFDGPYLAEQMGLTSPEAAPVTMS